MKFTENENQAKAKLNFLMPKNGVGLTAECF